MSFHRRHPPDRIPRASGFAALVGALALACASAPGATGGAGALSVEQFQQQLASAWHGVVSCVLGVDRASVPSTEAQLRIPPALQGTDITKAVATGRTRFDASAAARCIATLATASPPACFGATADWPAMARLVQTLTGFSTRRGRCAGVFTGLVQPGGMCALDEECADGWCDARADVCPGKCRALGGAQGGCDRMVDPSRSQSDDRLCPEGTYCRPQRGCEPAGAICGQDDECAAGLGCLINFGESHGGCGATLAAGARCFSGQACGPGLYCLQGMCTPQGGAGASCAIAAPFFTRRSPACAGNQTCAGDSRIVNESGALSMPGTCRTPQGVGGPCVQVSDAAAARRLSGCLGGLTCDPQTSTCVQAPLPPVGDAPTACHLP